jgi:hypothetical protein
MRNKNEGQEIKRTKEKNEEKTQLGNFFVHNFSYHRNVFIHTFPASLFFVLLPGVLYACRPT